MESRRKYWTISDGDNDLEEGTHWTAGELISGDLLIISHLPGTQSREAKFRETSQEVLLASHPNRKPPSAYVFSSPRNPENPQQGLSAAS